ncbi:MAG: Pycsar system effector family protein [Lewinella sp.]
MFSEEQPASEAPKKKKKKKKKVEEVLPPGFDKEREKAKGYDPRGVQTLFRTLSRNHYNLLKMIDNKASIILTINSIIISLLLGALYVAPESKQEVIQITARVLLNFCLVSMVISVISMLPHRYFEKRFQNSSYKGSLYAGNFAQGSLEEFQAEFNRITKSGETIYEEMIQDLYFLGRVIAIKSRIVWFSTLIFLLGLVIAIGASIVNEITLM